MYISNSASYIVELTFIASNLVCNILSEAYTVLGGGTVRSFTCSAQSDKDKHHWEFTRVLVLNEYPIG